MRKLFTVIVSLIIIITFTILIVRAGTIAVVIIERLSDLQRNQLNLEEIIFRLDLQLNEKITELSITAEVQSMALGIALNEVKSSGLVEIEEVKDLISSCTEEVRNKNAAKRLLSVNTLVESDNSIQQLLSQGSLRYKEEKFTAAIKIYRDILDIDPSNIEAICYLNASLFYQNPGDGSNFSLIKNILIPLIEGNSLTNAEGITVLNILMGISMEENNEASIKQYQDARLRLEEGQK